MNTTQMITAVTLYSNNQGAHSMKQPKPCISLNNVVNKPVAKLIMIITTIFFTTSLVYAKDSRSSASLAAISEYQPVHCIQQSDRVSICDCDHEPSILHAAACRITLNANCLLSPYGNYWECFHPASQVKQHNADAFAAVVDSQELHCTELNDSTAICDCDHEPTAMHAAACRIVLDANCSYHPNDNVWTCPIDPK